MLPGARAGSCQGGEPPAEGLKNQRRVQTQGTEPQTPRLREGVTGEDNRPVVLDRVQGREVHVGDKERKSEAGGRRKLRGQERRAPGQTVFPSVCRVFAGDEVSQSE